MTTSRHPLTANACQRYALGMGAGSRIYGQDNETGKPGLTSGAGCYASAVSGQTKDAAGSGIVWLSTLTGRQSETLPGATRGATLEREAFKMRPVTPLALGRRKRPGRCGTIPPRSPLLTNGPMQYRSNQSRPFPARSGKVMESAGPYAKRTHRCRARWGGEKSPQRHRTQAVHTFAASPRYAEANHGTPRRGTSYGGPVGWTAPGTTAPVAQRRARAL